MAAIIARHYEVNYAALAKEPVIVDMATDLVALRHEPVPFRLAHEDGEPTFEFMQAANAHYRRERALGRATTPPVCIGAVATAILRVKAEIEALVGATA